MKTRCFLDIGAFSIKAILIVKNKRVAFIKNHNVGLDKFDIADRRLEITVAKIIADIEIYLKRSIQNVDVFVAPNPEIFFRDFPVLKKKFERKKFLTRYHLKSLFKEVDTKWPFVDFPNIVHTVPLKYEDINYSFSNPTVHKFDNISTQMFMSGINDSHFNFWMELFKRLSIHPITIVDPLFMIQLEMSRQIKPESPVLILDLAHQHSSVYFLDENFLYFSKTIKVGQGEFDSKMFQKYGIKLDEIHTIKKEAISTASNKSRLDNLANNKITVEEFNSLAKINILNILETLFLNDVFNSINKNCGGKLEVFLIGGGANVSVNFDAFRELFDIDPISWDPKVQMLDKNGSPISLSNEWTVCLGMEKYTDK
ncbi:MAG: hypothetical protein JJV93_02020 [Alphaproteobacteria bacterium]|nr:hypothetical protein [Alphaproteobacteria bacterium]